jgi:hypothetical protein
MSGDIIESADLFTDAAPTGFFTGAAADRPMRVKRPGRWRVQQPIWPVSTTRPTIYRHIGAPRRHRARGMIRVQPGVKCS